MRTIKFRAWDINEKTMRYMGDNYVGDFFGFWVWYNKYAAELMQFTGLLDRNGKEIYEGDIIRTDCGFEDEDFFAQIVFKNSCWYLEDRTFDYIIGSGFDFEQDDVLVVGNIYEHPQLSKEDKT